MTGPYNAFVSYSHAADGLLAPRLQAALQGFARPWHRRRALEVFRDETGLSANPGLWSSIVDALDASEWFVLLASPESARSEWVNREVEHWCRTRGSAHILPVVTDGGWRWDPEGGDFDWAQSTAVPPALRGAFTEEPRHIDMRWARSEAQVDLRNGRFRDQIAEIAAPMHGLAKDDMAGADVRQHRRTRRLASSAVIVLLVLLAASVVGAVTALQQTASAQRSERSALVAQSESEADRRLAESERARAEASATEARLRRAEADAAALAADAAAAEADRQAANADASAAEAVAQRAEATASAAEAEAQRAEATASADIARARTVEADIAARRAQAAAAEAQVQRALAEANARQAADRAEALRVQALQLEQQARELLETNAEILRQAEALARSNTELDGRGLVALAQRERSLGNHDRAVLLLAEAVRTGAAPAPIRRELAAAILGSEHLTYLPGSGAGGDLLTAHGRVATGGAAGTDQGAQVWDLTRPGAAPVVLEGTAGTSGAAEPTSAGAAARAAAPAAPPPGAPPPPPPPPPPGGNTCDQLTGGPDVAPPLPSAFRRIELRGFDATGTRLVGIPGEFDAEPAHVWDADTGARLTLFGDGELGTPIPAVELTPDGTRMLVQAMTQGADGSTCSVQVVDLSDPAGPRVTGRWNGILRSSLGFTPGYERAADATDIGPDGRHFLFYEVTSGAWAVGDLGDGSQDGLPLTDASVFPRFTADGARVVGLVTPTLLGEWDTAAPDFSAPLIPLTDGPSTVAATVIALDVAGEVLAALGADGEIKRFVRSTGRQLSTTAGAACPGGGSMDVSSGGAHVVVDCPAPNFFPPGESLPRRALFVASDRPADVATFPLEAPGPITDLIDAPRLPGAGAHAVLASTGRILSLGELAGQVNEVPRLGLDGPCALTADSSALVCGAERLSFADLRAGGAAENLAGELPSTVTALGADDRTWFSVTPTGRVAHVDPDASRLEPVGPPVPPVPDPGNATLSPDGRWVIAGQGDDGSLALTEVATRRTRIVDVGDGPAELAGQLRGPDGGDTGPLVVTLVQPSADPGQGTPPPRSASVLLQPGTGAVAQAGLREFAVTSPTGTFVATWDGDSSSVEIRSAPGAALVRTVAAPGLASSGPRRLESARHFVAVSDDAALLAYIDLGDTPGETMQLRVLDAASGVERLAEPLRSDDDGLGSPGPRLAFSPDGSALILETSLRIQRWATSSWTVREVAVAGGGCDRAYGVSLPRFLAGGTLIKVDGRLLDSESMATVYAGLGCGSPPAAAAAGGEALVALGGDAGGLTVRGLSLDVPSLTAAGCRLAGRNLSVAEWAQVNPATARPQTCAQWP